MHARPVVVLGDLVEAGGKILPRTDPLGGVDGAGLQGAEDLADRQVDDGSAELAQRLAAEARNAHLEAFDVVRRLDFAVEPAGHLHARRAGVESFQAELAVDLVPQRLAAAIAQPRHRFDVGHAEGHGGVQSKDLGLVLVVVGRRMHAVGGAALHGVEGLEGGHQLAGREYLDGEPATGRLTDGLGKAFRRGAAAREHLRPARDHAPFLALLRDRGCRHRCHRRRRGHAAHRGLGKFTSLKFSHCLSSRLQRLRCTELYSVILLCAG